MSELEERLRSSKWQVRLKAVRQTEGIVGKERAAELLCGMLDDRCGRVKNGIAKALGKIGESAVAPLIKASYDWRF